MKSDRRRDLLPIKEICCWETAGGEDILTWPDGDRLPPPGLAEEGPHLWPQHSQRSGKNRSGPFAQHFQTVSRSRQLDTSLRCCLATAARAVAARAIFFMD